MFSRLLSHIEKHIPLSKEEEAFIISRFEIKSLKRKEFHLRQGEACTMFSYVNEGALRAYYYGPDDKEVTIMFAIADWWITDMPCFVTGSPSMINIEALADSMILQLSKDKMDSLLRDLPKLEKFFRILLQNAYVREQLRTLQNLSLPADVRYHNFLKKYPVIARYATQKNIASYLGITPEFLSAIRAKSK